MNVLHEAAYNSNDYEKIGNLLKNTTVNLNYQQATHKPWTMPAPQTGIIEEALINKNADYVSALIKRAEDNASFRSQLRQYLAGNRYSTFKIDNKVKLDENQVFNFENAIKIIP